MTATITHIKTSLQKLLLFVCLFTGLLLSLGTMNAYALEPVYTSWLSDNAVGGYDPVAYFTVGKPVKGDEAHSLEYKGATWLFASAENKSLFEAKPEKYAPGFWQWRGAGKNTNTRPKKYCASFRVSAIAWRWLPATRPTWT